MKKLLIVALFILGMCNASAFGMAHEIILTELYSVIDFLTKWQLCHSINVYSDFFLYILIHNVYRKDYKTIFVSVNKHR